MKAATYDKLNLWVALAEEGSLRVQSYDINNYILTSTKLLQSDTSTPNELARYKVVNGSHFFVFAKPFALQMSFKDSEKLVLIDLSPDRLPYQDFSCEI